MTVTRVPTYASFNNYVSRMISTQSNYAKYSNQALTGKLSDNYKDFGVQSHRLINLENEIDRNQQYMDNNAIASLRMQNTFNAVDNVKAIMDDFKSTMLKFTQNDLIDWAPDYGDVKEYIEGGAETTGDLTFDTATNTLTAVNSSVFSEVKAGQKIVIEGAAAGGNEGTYYVDSVSPDGRVITFANSTLLAADHVTPTGFNVNVGLAETVPVSHDHRKELEEMQTDAFNQLKQMEFFLNTKIDGRYIFGGGQTNEPPVNFPFESLEEFQAYYDGQKITFPETRAAMLADVDIKGATTGDLTFETVAPPVLPATTPTNADRGTITAANAGAFIHDSITATANVTGDVVFNSTSNTITVQEKGAFSRIEAGDTIVVGGADAGANAQVVYVDRVSEDGKTLFLSDDSPLAADLTVNVGGATDLNFGRSYPRGATIEMEGYDASVDGRYTVIGVGANGTSLEVRINPGEFPANGTPVTHTPSADAEITTTSYYKGDHLKLEQRISDTKVMQVGINAEDATFEKMFRALGILSQGTMIDERDPYDPNIASPAETDRAYVRSEKAMTLIEDALVHDPANQTEKTSDMNTTLQQITLNQLLIQKTTDEQKSLVNQLSVKADEIENVDPTEAVLNLLNEAQALQVSFSVMSKVKELSLVNYL